MRLQRERLAREGLTYDELVRETARARDGNNHGFGMYATLQRMLRVRRILAEEARLAAAPAPPPFTDEELQRAFGNSLDDTVLRPRKRSQTRAAAAGVGAAVGCAEDDDAGLAERMERVALAGRAWRV